jgi:hypothetical protein
MIMRWCRETTAGVQQYDYQQPKATQQSLSRHKGVQGSETHAITGAAFCTEVLPEGPLLGAFDARFEEWAMTNPRHFQFITTWTKNSSKAS